MASTTRLVCRRGLARAASMANSDFDNADLDGDTLPHPSTRDGNRSREWRDGTVDN
jgi:hypothetical protein